MPTLEWIGKCKDQPPSGRAVSGVGAQVQL